MASNEKPTDNVLLAQAMLLMAGADGYSEDSEIATVEGFASTLPEFQEGDVGQTIGKAQKLLRKYPSDKDCVAALRERSTPSLRIKAFLLAADIALASGDVDEAEDALLESMSSPCKPATSRSTPACAIGTCVPGPGGSEASMDEAGAFEALVRPRRWPKTHASHRRARACGDAPGYLPQLQQELLQVIAKYEKLDLDPVNASIDKRGDTEVLALCLTLPEGAQEKPRRVSTRIVYA